MDFAQEFDKTISATCRPVLIPTFELSIMSTDDISNSARRAVSDIAVFFGSRGLAGFGRWHLRTNTIDWTEGVCRILGIDTNSPISIEDFEAMVHPEDRIVHEDPIRNARDGLYDHRLIRIVRLNGELRWINFRSTVLYGADGEPETVLSILVDETANAHQLNLARNAERQLATLSAIPGLSLWRADLEGRMKDITNWTVLTGQETRQARGAGWLSSVPLHERAGIVETWKTATTTGQPLEILHHLTRADGTSRPVTTWGMPVKDRNGELREWSGVTILMPIEQPTRLEAAASKSAAPPPLTGPHIRAARSFLGWTAVKLAKLSGLSLSTIRRIEDSPGIPSVRDGAIVATRSALERGGIIFWTIARDQVAISVERPKQPQRG